MTTPKHSTIKHGQRHYTTPLGAWPSVTTIIRSKAAGRKLDEWRAKNAATAAVRATIEGELFDDAILAGVQTLDATSSEAELGTRVHAAIERYELDGTADPEDATHLAQWIACKERFGFEVVATEVTLVNKQLRYAGTADALVRFPNYSADTFILDVKTGKSVYADSIMQVAALAHCDTILDADGKFQRIPKTWGPIRQALGFVAQIRPRSNHLYDSPLTHAFDAFSACLLLHRWDAQQNAWRDVIDEASRSETDRVRMMHDHARKLIDRQSADTRRWLADQWSTTGWPSLKQPPSSWTSTQLDAVIRLVSQANQ